MRGVAACARHAGVAVLTPRVELLGEAGFTDARLARDDGEVRTPFGGEAPIFDQPLPFLLAADQWRRRIRPRRRQRGGGNGGRIRLEHLLEELAGGSARFHGKFAAQDAHALVIGAERARAVAVGRVQADQDLVVRLAQRILRHQPLGVPDCRGIIAALIEERCQSAENLGRSTAVVLALLAQPIVVQPRQQVVLAQAGGFFERLKLGGEAGGFGGTFGSSHRSIKLDDIDGAVWATVPFHGMMVGGEKTALSRQGAAQVMKELPEIGARLCLAGIGPQQEGQVFPRLHRLTVQNQVGQQRLEAIGIDRGDGLLAARDAEFSEQFDAERHSIGRQ